MGYYDREKAQWIPAKNGVVIAIVCESGGRAAVDVTGDGVADSAAALATFGIDDDELAKLADLYDPGKSLWRAAITHFTPWDYNWPYGLPDGAGGPDQGGPDGGDPAGDDPCGQSGSIILCEDQVLGEQAAIAGTPYTLAYQSDRVPGRRTGDSLEIPLTGATPPRTLARVDLTIEVAGRTIKESFPPRRTCARRSSSTARTPTGATSRAARRSTSRSTTSTRRSTARRARSAPRSRPSAARCCRPTARARRSRRPAVERHGRRPERARRARSPAGASTSTTPTTRSAAPSTSATAPSAARRARTSTSSRPRRPASARPRAWPRRPTGDLLVADSSAHVVRRVEPDGTTTVVAGTGTAGVQRRRRPGRRGAARPPVGRRGRARRRAVHRRRGQQPDPPDLQRPRSRRIAGTGEAGYSGDGGSALRPSSTSRPTSPWTRAAPSGRRPRQQRDAADRPRRHHHDAGGQRLARLRRRRRRGGGRQAALAARPGGPRERRQRVRRRQRQQPRAPDRPGRHDRDRRGQRQTTASAGTAGSRRPRSWTPRAR